MAGERPGGRDRVRPLLPVAGDHVPGGGTEFLHCETLEEEATHATDEARMILPGVQAIMGFQLIAVFNDRFATLDEGEQVLHLVAFLLITLAMGLIMAPAAYHRLAERGRVTRRFVDLASTLLCLALVPLMIGVSIDTYLIAYLVAGTRALAVACAASVLLILAALWFGLPRLGRPKRR
jgi:hypothetical protein